MSQHAGFGAGPGGTGPGDPIDAEYALLTDPSTGVDLYTHERGTAIEPGPERRDRKSVQGDTDSF
jgi:hypothetical protein